MSNEPRFDAVKVKVCAQVHKATQIKLIPGYTNYILINFTRFFFRLPGLYLFYFYSTPGPGLFFTYIHSFTFTFTSIRNQVQVPGYFAASNLLFAVHPPIWVTTRVFGIVVFVVRTSKDFNANTPSTSFNQHGQLLCSSINLCKITVF